MAAGFPLFLYAGRPILHMRLMYKTYTRKERFPRKRHAVSECFRHFDRLRHQKDILPRSLIQTGFWGIFSIEKIS